MSHRRKPLARGEKSKKPGPAPLPSEKDEPKPADRSPCRFPIVGIGASAGGLDAFKKFFTALPSESGMAFVLIPHLDPSHGSLMVELLSRQTKMKVREAAEDMPIEANCVYVIPPNRELSIREQRLHLTRPLKSSGFTTAIDGFFRSLAENCQEQAIGIVLSGTGSHGIPGLKEIKAVGGLIIAQAPETAEYDQMPRSAIDTGMIDYVLPPEKIPAALINYVRQPYLKQSETLPLAEAATMQLAPLLDLLRTRNKCDFSCYRKNMLMRRVLRRMGICHTDKVADYIAYISEHPEEVSALCRDLLISVTSFFRDPDAFQVLQHEVIPDLVARATAEVPVRVWVPACATGEEAYSLAILLLEQFTVAGQPPNFQIFASDIDEESLEVARRGVYLSSIVGELSPARLQQFFVKADDNHFQVNKQLRASVVVTRQNVISDPPFSKIDLISCRNLLIYLEPELQQKLLPLFHFALNEKGALFLGCSESVGQRTDLFESVSKKWRVFRRIGPARRDLVQVPILPGADYRARVSGSKLTPRPPLGFAELTQKILLAEYAPAAVLISRKYEILSFSGPTSNYLEQPTGDPTTDLMALARPGLRTKIRAVCHKLLNGGETRAETAARVQRDGSTVDCMITARLLHVPKEAEGLILVSFLERPTGAHPPETQLTNSHTAGNEEESAIVKQLEYEVESTREDLQSTIEELQSSNEEVMSMNEELQSANEELESSKEELQSLNEELSTMNSQLQDKNEGLEQTNDDIRNLLHSTEIATVFLDRDLRIRRFTPATAPLLNLIETDVGRPIRDIAPKFTDSRLVQDVGRVLDKLAVVETEICSDTGRWYLRRILPYRTSDNHIEGVVITFVDITQRIEAEAQSRRLAAVLRDSNDAVIVHDLDGRITAWNRGAEQMYGYTEPEAIERHMGDLIPEADRAAHDELVSRITHGDQQIRSFETRRVTRDGRQLDVWLTVTRLTDDRGNPTAIATTERDITNRKRKEAEIRQLTIELEERVKQRTSALEIAMTELRRKEREFRTFADNVPALFNYVDATRRYRFVNKEYEKFFRLPAQEIIGKTIEELLGNAKYKVIEPHIDEVLAGKRVQFETEVKFPIGRHIVQTTFEPDFDEQGTVAGFFTLIYDITERKRIEDALGESERRLRAIVDSAADAIITIGEQGIIDTFNSAAERMFGYSAQEAIGQNVKILMPAPYREEHDGYLSRYLKTGEARVIGISRELIAQRKDGTTFPIEVAVSEFADATQQLFTGIVRDLSERKALQNELLTILSEEQRRIGQDLHDVVGQELTGLSLLTKSLSLSLEEHRGADAETVTRLGAGIAKTLEQIRKLSKGLIPVEIDSEGLAAALLRLSGNVSQDAGIQCDFVCNKTVLVGNNNTATHLYRIAQEAVTNALKHGAPRRIRISLEQDKDGLILGIRDDGKGISIAVGQAEGMGLKIMQYRASLIGASLSVAAVKAGGTLVTCRLLENRTHG